MFEMWRFKRKVRRDAQSLSELTGQDAQITEIDMRDGTLRLGMAHPVVFAVAEHLAKFFEDSGGINYVEMKLYSPRTGPLVVSVQRQDGKTPHELKVESEAKVKQLEEEIARLKEAAP